MEMENEMEMETSAICSLSERLHQAAESFWGDFSSFSILIRP